MNDVFTIGIITSVVVIWGIATGKIMYFHFVTVKSWNKTKGTIINSEIKWVYNKDDSVKNGYRKVVIYKYVVNSKEYFSDVISKNLKLYSTSKLFLREDNFKIGQNVEVTYNPKKPSDAVLITDLDYSRIIFSTGFLVISITIILLISSNSA